MRLTEQQRMTIHTSAKEIFGESAVVRLFGSRVDDISRGGDIDLLIETSQVYTVELTRSEIAFQTKLQKALGEQKIDLLLAYPSRKNYPPIFQVAKQNGVLL